MVLVADAPIYDTARKMFREHPKSRRSIVLQGATPMTKWVCRALRGRAFSIRVFEQDRERAEQLAVDLEWVTVIASDVNDATVFAEERIQDADHFVALRDDDEDNIIAGVLAKLRGVDSVTVIVQRSTYLDSVYAIGLDRAYSPRTVAAKQIEEALDERPVRTISKLADGSVSVFRVRVGPNCEIAGQRLRTIKLTPGLVDHRGAAWGEHPRAACRRRGDGGRRGARPRTHEACGPAPGDLRCALTGFESSGTHRDELPDCLPTARVC